MSILSNIMTAILDSTHAKDMVKSVAEKVETAAAGTAPEMKREDIDAILQRMDDEQGEDLDWEHSIVDLMKLLNLDSSLRAREHLAHELGYTGALDGSARMNNWLHTQVMNRLAESGGKVPDSLRG